MSELEVFGTRCLELLSDNATVTVLAHLREQPASAVDIQEAGLGIGDRVALTRLRKLVSRGIVDLVDHQDTRSRSPRMVPHRLRTSGHAIETLIDVAAGCESDWPPDTKAFRPGTAALAVASDRKSRAIARALAYQRLRLSDLERMLPEMKHGTLVRRLRDRAAQGLIHSEKEGHDAWQTLTDTARRMVTIPLYSACWEWHFGDRDKRLLASDLAGLVHQLAPLVHIPEELNGICLLHDDWHTTFQSDIYLAAGSGRLAPFVIAPSHADITAQGTPKQWIQALITGDRANITSTGDPAFLSAVVVGLHQQLRHPQSPNQAPT